MIAWNTVYIGRVLDALRAEGHEVREEDVTRLSPARFEHINPYGKYTFDNPPRPGSYRPLRP